MTRYIEADSVRDEILYGEAYVSAELEVYIKKVFDYAPIADVVEVVRCANCVYHTVFDNRDMCTKHTVFWGSRETGLR